MKMDEKEYDFDELYRDYLKLFESYKDKMPLHEFGFGMIRIVSKMLFDGYVFAKRIIEKGMNEGYYWSQEENKEEE